MFLEERASYDNKNSLIRNNETGLNFDVNDSKDLSKMLSILIENSEIRNHVFRRKILLKKLI